MIGTEGNPWTQDGDNEGYWQALLRQGSKVSQQVPAQPPVPPAAWQAAAIFPEQGTKTGQNGADEDYSSFQAEEEGWRWLQRCYQGGDVLELLAESHNRGGLLVDCDGVQGFVPASQLSDMGSQINSQDGRDSYLSGRVGEHLDLKIIELDRDAERVILSERAAKWEGKCPDSILESLVPGDVCRGQVSNLCSFGAFVDLGGVDGLIHVSELSWQRVEHPRDLLKPGQEIEVYIMEVDCERKRVALSLKRLQPDPWDRVEERYRVGQTVTGAVTNVVDFGAFVQVEDGLEGLVHISELAEGNFLHPRNVVGENDVVTARIVHIDGAAHRLGLSLRQVYSSGAAVSEDTAGDVNPVSW